MTATKRKEKFDTWRGKVFLALLSICFSCTLAFAAGEIYFRLTGPYRTPDTLRAESLEYESVFFARHTFPQMVQSMSKPNGAIAAVINSRGYRGREFEVPKPENIIRIVVLGGSAGFDIYALKDQDWPHLVEKKLQEYGYTNVEVINAATPGHATWDSLGRLYSEIWMFEPDYVVVYHAWNDIKDFRGLNPNNSLLRRHRSTTVFAGNYDKLAGNPFIYYTGPIDRLFAYSQFYVRLRELYWKWHFGDIELEGVLGEHITYSDTYSDWGVRQYKLNLRLISDAVRDIDATPIFLTQARLVSNTSSEAERRRVNLGNTKRDLVNYHFAGLSYEALVRAFADTDQAILEVAEIEDVKVLDLSSFNGQSDLFVDHVHTTSKGSEIIAQAVADFLADVLDDVTAR